MLEHPELSKYWHDESNYIALLAVKDENSLLKLLTKACSKNIPCSFFREPDLDNEITAVVLSPGLDSKRLCSNIGLMGGANN